MQLKEHKLHFYSKIFQACQIGTYMIPQIFEQWISRNIRNFSDPNDELITEVRRWYYLEESVFFSQINFGILFLLYAYSFKLRSIWQDNKPTYRRFDDKRVIVDIWNQKSCSDFLHYLKFEFMQYVFIGSYFFTSFILVTFRDFFIDGNTTMLVEYTKLDYCVMCLGIAHALQLILLTIKLQRRKKVKNYVRIFTMITLMFSIICLYAIATFFFLDGRIDFVNSGSMNTRIVIWAYIELFSIPASIVYGFLGFYYYTANKKTKKRLFEMED